MIQIDWTYELIALLVSIYALTLVLAAAIAKRMDRRQDASVDLLMKKIEAFDERLDELKHDGADLRKKLLLLKEKQGEIAAGQQKLELVAAQREKLTNVADHAREIKKLNDMVVELVDSIDEVGLEAIKMELHLARFAIRKGRHQIEAITRTAKQDLYDIAEQVAANEKEHDTPG